MVEGEEIVLSSGAVVSPKLLMLSGVGPAVHLREMGIPVTHDAPGVGQNLRDHPIATVLYRAKGERPDVQAPVIQVCTRYTAPGSHLKSDMIISPTLLTSEHRPTQIDIDDDDTGGAGVEHGQQRGDTLKTGPVTDASRHGDDRNVD